MNVLGGRPASYVFQCSPPSVLLRMCQLGGPGGVNDDATAYKVDGAAGSMTRLPVDVFAGSGGSAIQVSPPSVLFRMPPAGAGPPNDGRTAYIVEELSITREVKKALGGPAAEGCRARSSFRLHRCS